MNMKYIDKLINEVGNLFDFSESEYINNRIPIKVKCKLCNKSSMRIPWNIFKAKSCKFCHRERQPLTTEQFIMKSKEIHGEKYDYSNVEYKSAYIKVNIVCNKCGNIFTQTPKAHIYEKQGCPTCKESHGETRISNLLKIFNVSFEREKTFSDCKGIGGNKLKFDFYIPSKNLCIEYDGKQHSLQNSKFWSESLIQNDQLKNEFCKRNNIVLKRIDYKDYNQLAEIISSILAIPPIP